MTSDQDVDANCQCRIPKANGQPPDLLIPTDMRHDMHVTIVTFEPGGVIPFAETHVMEHGLFVLEGKAVYKLNQDWVEVEAGTSCGSGHFAHRPVMPVGRENSAICYTRMSTGT